MKIDFLLKELSGVDFILMTITIVAILLFVTFIFGLFFYCMGYFFEYGKLKSIDIYLKESFLKKTELFDAIISAETIGQMSRMQAYDKYYQGGKKDERNDQCVQNKDGQA